MKKFNQTSRRRMLTVVTLILALVILPCEVLAWFVMNERINTGSIGMDVTSGTGAGDTNLDMNIGVGAGLATDFAITMLPEETSGADTTFSIDIRNNGSEQKNFFIVLDGITVKYPTSAVGFSYDDKYVFLEDDYFVSGGLPYDITASGAMNEEIFRKFVAPVTNVWYYEIYYTNEPIGFHAGLTRSEYKYISEAANATAVDLANPSGVSITVPTDNKMRVSSEKNTSTEVASSGAFGNDYTLSDGVTVLSDGSVTLGAGKEITLYLLIGYDGEKYSSADLSDNAEPNIIELRNSNPFMSQKVSLRLKLNPEL